MPRSAPAKPSPAKKTSPQNPWGFPAARVIAFVSHKGGVGKTTSAVNLGATFALSGHRTLLVGLDPQCGVSLSLGYDAESLRGGLKDVLTAGLPLAGVIHGTPLTNLGLLSPNARSMAQEEQYKSGIGRYGVLESLLDQVRDDYDTILLDCPPGFGPETRAALTVADSYFIPVQAEDLCRNTVRRMLDFIREFGPVARKGQLLEGLFLTMTDARLRMSRQVSEQLRKEFRTAVFKTPIPRAVRLAEMSAQGKPAVIHDRRGRGSRAYFKLMDEIMTRHAKRPRPAPGLRDRMRVFARPGTSARPGAGRHAPMAASGNGARAGAMSRLWRHLMRRGDGESLTGGAK